MTSGIVCPFCDEPAVTKKSSNTKYSWPTYTTTAIYAYAKTANDHPAEETADVTIRLHQPKTMHGIPDDAISDRMEAKTIRPAKRMEES